MLRELKIENLAIIDKLELEFENGFIVLTGETGAGKSIILSGINLLIGEKATVDMIRTGKDSLLAQGVFEVNQTQSEELAKKFDIEVEDSEVIVRRTLDIKGKNKVYVNGVRVSLTTLKEIMGTLVDIVGQHSHQMLLNKSNHIKLLDRFLGDTGREVLKNVSSYYNHFKEVEKRIENIEKDRKEAIEKREFYEFQLAELEKINPKKDEDIYLEDEYRKLFNGGKIKEKFENSLYSLRDGEINAMHLIYEAKKNVESLCGYGEEFEEVLEKLEKVYYELEDTIDVIDTLNEDFDIDDRRLDEVISRLDTLNRMKSKYGTTIEEVLEFKSSIAQKIDLLDENSFELKNLLKEREEICKEYWKWADKLHNLRMEKAVEIEKNLKGELKFLKMEDAKIHVVVDHTKNMGESGANSVEILISTNVGQDLKPLWKIASGGEVSRIMLALKVIFSRVDNVPILIFDEIDTGVGGETVKKIADKLREIGEHAQVVSITHSPAIASKAHQQFFIKKHSTHGTTSTVVTLLNEEERALEIGRMLAGENVSEAVLSHARELLKEGR